MVVSAVASQDFFSQEFYRQTGEGRSWLLLILRYTEANNILIEGLKKKKMLLVTDLNYVHIVIAVIFSDLQKTK